MSTRRTGGIVVVITRAALSLALVCGAGLVRPSVPPARAAEILEESDLPESGAARRDEDDWATRDGDRDREEDRDFTEPDRAIGERDAAEAEYDRDVGEPEYDRDAREPEYDRDVREAGSDRGGPGARVEDSLERAGEGTHRALEHGAEPVGNGLERAMRATGRGLRAAIDGTGEFFRRAGDALTGRDDE